MRNHTGKLCLVLIAYILLNANHLQAQRPLLSIDTSTTEGLYQYIFQNFNKARVPTGYLEEFGVPIIPMETFDGILTDSNKIDIDLWRILYWQMQTAYLGSGTNAFGTITIINNLIDTSLAHNSGIPVPILLGTFNSVSPTAFTSNELKIVSGQVEDGTNNQNPFLSNNLFASCPAFNYSKTYNPSFIFSQNLVFNNTSKTISSISVNLGDNVGLRTVSWNTPVVASYTDTGWFSWTIKVVLSDNSTLQCYSKFYVAGSNGGIVANKTQTSDVAETENKSINTQRTRGGSSIKKPFEYSSIAGNILFDYQPYNVSASIYVPPSASYSGVYNSYVPIQYSTQNTSGKLLNPLIVVEGFDPASIAPDLTGPYQMSDFVNAISDFATSPFQFNTQLDEVGKYDLVFVTFQNGTDDIVRNAALLEYVIQQVNILKGTSVMSNI